MVRKIILSNIYWCIDSIIVGPNICQVSVVMHIFCHNFVICIPDRKLGTVRYGSFDMHIAIVMIHIGFCLK